MSAKNVVFTPRVLATVLMVIAGVAIMCTGVGFIVASAPPIDLVVPEGMTYPEAMRSYQPRWYFGAALIFAGFLVIAIAWLFKRTKQR